MGMLRLAPEIQQHILSMPDIAGRSPVTERMLRPIGAIADQRDQLRGRIESSNNTEILHRALRAGGGCALVRLDRDVHKSKFLGQEVIVIGGFQGSRRDNGYFRRI